MTLNPAALLDYRFAAIEQSYTARDAILYALGIGLGTDPLDRDDLDYLLESRLKLLPTFAATLSSPGMWIRDPALGVDFARLVHVEQDVTFHRALPTSATVSATPRIASLTDRGPGKGAVVVVEREIVADDLLLATVRQSLLLRGDGGFGGPPADRAVNLTVPQRPADHRLEVPISPRAALIYRLSGDWNPLHADPDYARSAGFERPILHGLASYGIAGRAIMRATGRTLKRLACRFAGIIVPGDRLDLSLWQESDRILFEASVGERRVLDRGLAVVG